jgi:hypothetical protein
MAGRGPQTFQKKLKEQQRKEKQQEKMAKRLERRRRPEASPEESPAPSEELAGTTEPGADGRRQVPLQLEGRPGPVPAQAEEKSS